MKKSVKIAALLLAVAMFAALFVSCGQASDLEKVKKSGKLVMLTNAAFPPFEYLGSDGKAAGVDVDIATAIAEEIGVELEVVDMEFNGIIAALVAGKGDIAAAGMTVTEERLQSIDFSNNYVTSAQYMLVPIDNTDILSSADLKGKVVGVQEGTTGDLYASGDWDEDYGVAEILRFANCIEAATALMNGKCDLVITDEMPAKSIVSKNSDVLKLVDEPLTAEDYAIGIRKNSDLTEIINKKLNEMIEDGTIEQILLKHTAE